MARISCSPASWGQVLFERVLDEAASLGLHGVEANEACYQSFQRQPGKLLGLLEERGLTLSGVPFTAELIEREERPAELERLRRWGAFLAETAPGAVIIFRTPLHPARRDMLAGVPPLLPLTGDRVARLGDALNEVGEMCQQVGLTGAFQHRVGTYVETPDEFLEVLNRTEPDLMRIAFDTGHWAYAGGDVAAFVQEHRRRLAVIRLKDFQSAVFTRIENDRRGFRDFMASDGFTAAGQGNLDLEQALMPLAVRVYPGWITIDVEAPLGDPRPPVGASRTFLRERLHW